MPKEFISSDTNVWIDFLTISKLTLPFLLPYTYIMYEESIASELLTPSNFKDDLSAAGLQAVDITVEEYESAEMWENEYPRLSVQDRIALAIAKHRNIVLLTGDRALREAAQLEKVPIMGTIGILDKLYEGNYITAEVFSECIGLLLEHNGKDVRLPRKELEKRLDMIKKVLHG